MYVCTWFEIRLDLDLATVLSVISTADNEGICNPESNNVFITFQISLDTALLLLMTTEAAAAMQWPIRWEKCGT